MIRSPHGALDRMLIERKEKPLCSQAALHPDTTAACEANSAVSAAALLPLALFAVYFFFSVFFAATLRQHLLADPPAIRPLDDRRTIASAPLVALPDLLR